MVKRIIIKNHDIRKDYLKDVVKELVKQRKKLSITQEELNARLGIADRLLGKWESGTRTPTSFNLYCWALSLGLKLTVIPRAVNDNQPDNYPHPNIASKHYHASTSYH